MDYLGPRTICEITEQEATDFEASKKRWTKYNLFGTAIAVTAAAVGGIINYFSPESSIADRFVEAGLVGLLSAGVSAVTNFGARVEREDGRLYLKTILP